MDYDRGDDLTSLSKALEIIEEGIPDQIAKMQKLKRLVLEIPGKTIHALHVSIVFNLDLD